MQKGPAPGEFAEQCPDVGRPVPPDPCIEIAVDAPGPAKREVDVNARHRGLLENHLGRTQTGFIGVEIHRIFALPKALGNRKIDAEKHPKTSSSSLFRKEQML